MTEHAAMDATASLADFLDAAAAKRPTPGGGSVAALAGALAASMGSMVLNYSVNKKDLQPYRAELEQTLAAFERARILLLELMVEDQDGFAALTVARKNRTADEQAFAVALAAAIRIPQAVGATAVALLGLIERVAGKVNSFLLSDLAVCGDLAMATLRCALHNVHANLPDVVDPAERARLMAETDRMLRQGVELIRRLSPRITLAMG